MEKKKDDYDYLYDPRRLIEISDSLRSLKKKSMEYLENYEKSENWKGFKQGFLAINVQLSPKDITNFETCALGTSNPEGFVSPETKKITMCSNFIENYGHFEKLMTFHMTMIYDMYRANIDYGKCEQLACMHVRAINLSKLCTRSLLKDREKCFKEKLKDGLFKKEICEGRLEEVFEKVFKSCSVDFAPFNIITRQKSFLNF